MLAPVISITIINCVFIRTLEKKVKDAENATSCISTKSAAISNYEKSELLVKRLVWFLIVTVTPYLLVRLGINAMYAVCSFSKLHCTTKNYAYLSKNQIQYLGGHLKVTLLT